MMNRGSSLVSTVLAVAAAAGVGVAGYMMLGGNCSLCTAETDAAAATPVAATEEEGMSCCPGDVDATATLVTNEGAVEGEACEAACDMAKEDCADKADCEVVCETACEDAAAETVAMEGEACESACDGEKATAEMVAGEGEACEGKVCPVTGEPIADAGQ